MGQLRLAQVWRQDLPLASPGSDPIAAVRTASPATDVLSLAQLDAFLVHARSQPELAQRLQQPLELDELLALSAAHGYAVEEADVIAAQVREEQRLSDQELQRRAGQEARRLRTFIPG